MGRFFAARLPIRGAWRVQAWADPAQVGHGRHVDGNDYHGGAVTGVILGHVVIPALVRQRIRIIDEMLTTGTRGGDRIGVQRPMQDGHQHGEHGHRGTKPPPPSSGTRHGVDADSWMRVVNQAVMWWIG
jgi:hypothetical protein